MSSWKRFTKPAPLPAWPSTMRSARLGPEPASAAEWQQVEVRFPFSGRAAVGPVDLVVRPGERVLLLGASGSGKSTLLLTLTGLIPKSIPASVTGRIIIFGADTGSQAPWGWAAQVAQYFQDADQTLCGMSVEDEIAFPLENRAMPAPSIAEAVATAMQQVGLPDAWRHRRTSTLPGGERQLVALAATLAQDAPLFVTDEPTAHLAPAAARRLHALLTSRRRDRAILIVDHKLDGLVEWIDRVFVLGNEGRIVAAGHPRTVFRDARGLLASLGVWRPVSSALDAALADAGAAPPDAIQKARPAVEIFLDTCTAPAVVPRPDRPILARLIGADCAPFLGPTVLRGVNLAIHDGEILGVLGANGAGKSTLGACLSGHLALKGGTRSGHPSGIAFQRAENQFTTARVDEEIATTLPGTMAAPERAGRVAEALVAWGLSGLEARHPLDLSMGEQRRLALAALTASDRWPLLVLDEPMGGLDAHGAAKLVENIEALGAKGRAIALITHDMELALRLCARSVVLGEGRVLAEGPTRMLLADSTLLGRAGLAEPSSAEANRWLRRVVSC